MKKREKVLVLGCGPIGIVVVAVAVALGVKEVVVTDFTDSRIAYMKKQFPEAKISGLNIRVCLVSVLVLLLWLVVLWFFILLLLEILFLIPSFFFSSPSFSHKNQIKSKNRKNHPNKSHKMFKLN